MRSELCSYALCCFFLSLTINNKNSSLATPTTSDPGLKSSIHSNHNNRKTLELFNKSSVVDFTIDEILTEPGNESEITLCMCVLKMLPSV